MQYCFCFQRFFFRPQGADTVRRFFCSEGKFVVVFNVCIPSQSCLTPVGGFNVCVWSHSVEPLCSASDTLEKTKADNRMSVKWLIPHSSEQGRTICLSLYEVEKNWNRETETQCMMDLVLSGRSGTSMMSAVFCRVRSPLICRIYCVKTSERVRERRGPAGRRWVNQTALSLSPSCQNHNEQTFPLLHFTEATVKCKIRFKTLLNPKYCSVYFNLYSTI